MKTRRILPVLLALILIGSAGPAAWAQSRMHKVQRGLGNVLTCWFELPRHLHLGSREANPVAGIGIGVLKGVGLTLIRFGTGLFETVTFPIEYPEGYVSPYEGMELPDYPWQ